MKLSEIDLNVLFSNFLPYGYTSPQALELAIQTSYTSWIEYDPEHNMNEREEACSAEHLSRLYSLRKIQELGYAQASTLKIGQYASMTIRMVALTKAGFYLATGTPPDISVEEERQSICKNSSRNLFAHDHYAAEEMTEIYRLGVCHNSSQEVINERESMMLMALKDDLITPAAYKNFLVPNIDVKIKGRPAQIYRNIRLSNINSLFRANHFLTQIDRRPIFLNNIRKNQIKAETAINRQMENYFVSVINDWHTSHKEFFFYNSYIPDDSDDAFYEWIQTPAFYSASEVLPDSDSNENEAKLINEIQTANARRFGFAGIAIGNENIYIVHHTKQLHTFWSQNTERETMLIVKDLVEKEANGDRMLGAGKPVINALIFCSTVHQFAELFTSVSKKLKRRLSRNYPVARPYNNINLIPICHSSVIQLRGLMYSNPIAMRQSFVMNYSQYQGFSETHDLVYPLRYNGRRVFLAYDLNFQFLYMAWLDYEAGEDFVVMCYPEHAKFIRKLMPNITFL